jgi:hypothetical protein
MTGPTNDQGPGWYPCPLDGEFFERWWDGSAWTDTRRDTLDDEPEHAPIATLIAQRKAAMKRAKRRYWRGQWADMAWVTLGARPTRRGRCH